MRTQKTEIREYTKLESQQVSIITRQKNTIKQEGLNRHMSSSIQPTAHWQNQALDYFYHRINS